MTKIHKVKNLPDSTLITKGMTSIDYCDSYMIVKNTDDPIEMITKKIMTLPGWITFALRVRYYLIVIPFGLSTGKVAPQSDNFEEEPEMVPVIDKNDNEIVMGADDKHLYYRISVMKKGAGQGTKIYLNTAVRFNNIWGKMYFVPVKIGHKLVVKSILKKLATSI